MASAHRTVRRCTGVTLLVAGLMQLSLVGAPTSAARTASDPGDPDVTVLPAPSPAPTSDTGTTTPDPVDPTDPTTDAGTDPGTGSTTDRRRRSKATIRIATYNVYSAVRPRNTMKDLRRLSRLKVDIMALQEMSNGTKRQAMRRQLVDCRGCDWKSFVPSGAIPGATPILWRKDQYKLVKTGSRQVTRATRVGPKGAGPSVLRAKYINWVRLIERRTGRTVWVFNNHTVPTVQGRGGGPNRQQPKRLRLYRAHMKALRSMVAHAERAGGLVFATGDLNVNYRVDQRLRPRLFPLRQLGSVGMRPSYGPLGAPRIGTHDLGGKRTNTRLIDYVYFLRREPLRVKNQKIHRGYHSDHRPLVVGFRVVGKPRRGHR